MRAVRAYGGGYASIVVFTPITAVVVAPLPFPCLSSSKPEVKVWVAEPAWLELNITGVESIYHCAQYILYIVL